MAQTFGRTRSQDRSQASTISYRYDHYGNDGKILWNGKGSSPANWYGSRKTTSDQPHIGFKRAIARGEVIMGDLLMVIESRSGTTASVSWWDANARNAWYYEGDFAYVLEGAGSLDTTVLADIGRMCDVALVKAMANAQSAPIVGGELLSELDRTLGMLRRPFRGASDLLLRMTKAKNRRLGKTVKSATQAASDVWLEYRYGWKPLILDARQIVRDYAKKQRSRSERLVARASQRGTQTSSGIFKDVNLWTGEDWSASGSRRLEIQVNVGAGVIYERKLTSPSQHPEDYFGMSANYIPETLWELTPYSFVVDWFVNTGEWIQATVPNPSVTHLGNWVTSVTKSINSTSVDVLIAKKFFSPSTGGSGPGGSSRVERVVVSRECNRPIPTSPSLTMKPLSLTHAADALALSCQKVLSGLQNFRH